MAREASYTWRSVGGSEFPVEFEVNEMASRLSIKKLVGYLRKIIKRKVNTRHDYCFKNLMLFI